MRPEGTAQRPGLFCHELLQALEASEGRRKRRKRDQKPDTIGLQLKRELLEAAVREDPDPEAFEGWLLDHVLRAGPGSGMVRAMAQSIWDEWRLVAVSPEFSDWLARGAPSDDRDHTGDAGSAASAER